jgi:hypothetical protein
MVEAAASRTASPHPRRSLPPLAPRKKNVPTHLDYLDYLDRRYPKCNTTLARGMRPAGETSTVMPLRKPNATAGAVPQGAAAPVRTPVRRCTCRYWLNPVLLLVAASAGRAASGSRLKPL